MEIGGDWWGLVGSGGDWWDGTDSLCCLITSGRLKRVDHNQTAFFLKRNSIAIVHNSICSCCNRAKLQPFFIRINSILSLDFPVEQRIYYS